MRVGLQKSDQGGKVDAAGEFNWGSGWLRDMDSWAEVL